MSESPYGAASSIPLIKSPSLRVPRPVELPQDIHPLPESVNPYFVYPFTIEPHTITLESSRRTTLAAHTARREAYLRSRDDERERRKREALRRIAPGFEPHGSLLVPTMTKGGSGPQEAGGANLNEHTTSHQPARSVMDDLVDQLAALEGSSSKTDPSRPLS
ncbi:hypothetical protein GALMADRAFT_258810 [Galerina marginata CBS 339.88]|uniref:Uncharacterized protein n=1 Tax=Galerina marginata (strain CBS 339.88) TaxID=685588 RepID=A0A067SAI3_GALM3|nr:hypothetical protein GALMADRAFT_258810 [Galerina marginata CBS 339.88]